MKVLMFGWEFPPYISGGLGTACHGLTHSLQKQGVKVLFVVPRLFGNEPSGDISLINASAVGIPRDKYTIKSSYTTRRNEAQSVEGNEITTIEVDSPLMPYHEETPYHESSILHWNYSFPKTSETENERVDEKSNELNINFSGSYGPNLMKEVEQYAIVGTQVSKQNSFDVIHAHDWLTFPAGIAAKETSGKPLIVHVHATEFDRSGENVNPLIYNIEKKGLDTADRIIAVSQWTKNILVSRYGVPEEKVEVVHNGVVAEEKKTSLEKKSPFGPHVVTFMGRVTYQKGPIYFVDAAKEVLKEFPNAHFVMAGSGDLLPQMVEHVAHLQISANFHFTGFLRKNEIDKIWDMTSIYVMPSVSEPFGITPLEAIQGGVPVILSKQSGVAEVMPHAITVDFWNKRALAGAICSMLRYGSLMKCMQENGQQEIGRLNWNVAASKVNRVYDEITIKNRKKSRVVLSGSSTKKVEPVELL
ncbi:glycosyltransferase [Pseudochryseolinea flava]|uniref:Glycosyltransferase family 1 protein n=1 Tax=Pseudochryseolinea flava TaxID=2059302 RepID=A0A364Y413_9BACT|nr:glycosyltransferase [Pseudochryseolinea flava]RAW00928.1 glycosyltransferase family 1 protein [Pseudochryseolinea flava]